MPKNAGVKSWSAFARGTSTWSILEEGGVYAIESFRKTPPRGWEVDPEKQIEFPPGTILDEVIDRMIAILQEAAATPSK